MKPRRANSHQMFFALCTTCRLTRKFAQRNSGFEYICSLRLYAHQSRSTVGGSLKFLSSVVLLFLQNLRWWGCERRTSSATNDTSRPQPPQDCSAWEPDSEDSCQPNILYRFWWKSHKRPTYTSGASQIVSVSVGGKLDRLS